MVLDCQEVSFTIIWCWCHTWNFRASQNTQYLKMDKQNCQILPRRGKMVLKNFVLLKYSVSYSRP